MSNRRGDELSPDICGSKVILFLGAGASAALGLDLMDSFMDRLERSIPEHRGVLQQMYTARGGKRDLEILFHRLEDYGTVEDYCQNDPNWTNTVTPNKVVTLMTHVQAIKERTEDLVVRHYSVVNSGDAVALYTDLVTGLLERNTPRHLPVFTTNYDTAVETFVDGVDQDLQLVDGFSTGQVLEWLPDQEFDQYQYSVRGAPSRTVLLFKLHGSCTWYRRINNEAVIKAGGVHVRLSEDPELDNALVWPRETKHIPEGPYRVNYQYLRGCLAQASWCVVIGFSFRDAETRRYFLDSLASNAGLRLVIIDPSAERLIGDTLGLEVGKRVNAIATKFGLDELPAIAGELTSLGIPFHEL
jgi:hypothetical protein